ncbi:MAG: hypothetical protein GY941_25090 [Planctomycetes bacterium]|nr:hypothetical protein [Planctomycetota bacterium]
MRKKRRLLDEYHFPGLRPRAEIKRIFGYPKARVIRLSMVQKKQIAEYVDSPIETTTTRKYAGYETCLVGMLESIWKCRFAVFFVGSAKK